MPRGRVACTWGAGFWSKHACIPPWPSPCLLINLGASSLVSVSLPHVERCQLHKLAVRIRDVHVNKCLACNRQGLDASWWPGAGLVVRVVPVPGVLTAQVASMAVQAALAPSCSCSKSQCPDPCFRSVASVHLAEVGRGSHPHSAVLGWAMHRCPCVTCVDFVPFGPPFPPARRHWCVLLAESLERSWYSVNICWCEWHCCTVRKGGGTGDQPGQLPPAPPLNLHVSAL